MKSNFLILIFILSSLTGCHSQINDTDGQVSKSIKESKQNGFYLKSYIIASSTDSNISLKEAWVEKGWFYEIHKDKAVKVSKDFCHLCFTLKQTPRLAYNFKNLANWQIYYPIGKRYVGRTYSQKNGYYDGIYFLSFNNCNIPDTITLDLLKEINTSTNLTEKKVGTLTLGSVSR